MCALLRQSIRDACVPNMFLARAFFQGVCCSQLPVLGVWGMNDVGLVFGPMRLFMAVVIAEVIAVVTWAYAVVLDS